MTENSSLSLTIDVQGYAGPLDLLLDLAKRRKLDLLCLSIADLADQYLAFLETARALQLSIKAEYLVMAAQLTRLKARLLAPRAEDDGDDAERAAEALRESLLTLQHARRIADFLRSRPQLGHDMFAFGAKPNSTPGATPNPDAAEEEGAIEASLIELLEAYARLRHKPRVRAHPVSAPNLYKYEQAQQALAGQIKPEWQAWWSYVPRALLAQGQARADSGLFLRSVASGFFCAMLALVNKRAVEVAMPDGRGELQIRAAYPRARPRPRR